MVTGPALSSSTSIIAPKLPVATGTPLRRINPTISSTSASARSGAAALGERRPTSLAHIGQKRELADNQHRPANIDNRAIHPLLVIGKDAETEQLVDNRLGIGRSVLVADAEQNKQSSPICPTVSSSTVTDALATR